MELSYETARACVQKRLFEKLNRIDRQAEESAASYSERVAKVLSHVDALLVKLKSMEFRTEAQLNEYEHQRREEFFQLETSLTANKILEAKVINGRRTTLGTLKKLNPNVRN